MFFKFSIILGALALCSGAQASWISSLKTDIKAPVSKTRSTKPDVELTLLQTQYLTEPTLQNQFDSFTYLMPRYTSYSNVDRTLSHGVDVDGVLSLSEGGESHLYVPELYLQSDLKLRSGFSLTLGRKIEAWSRMDSQLNLGLWQPLFRWDHARPVEMGLTGLTLQKTWKTGFVRAFASPLYLPDQQPKFEVKDGKITSGNRWVRPPISSLEFGNSPSDIMYSVRTPKDEDVLRHASYAAQGYLGREEGPWASLSWARKPMNQFHLGIEIQDSYRADGDTFQPVVNPVVVDHNLLTFESGFTQRDWNVYASMTAERIEDPELPANWEQTELIDSNYWGLGFSHHLELFKKHLGRLNWSYVTREKKKQGDKVTRIEGEVEASTQRMAFENWLTLEWTYELRLKAKRALASTVAYHYSPSDAGDWIAGDIVYHIDPQWRVFTSFDIFGVRDETSKSPSFITYYQNNDRLQGGMQYVF